MRRYSTEIQVRQLSSMNETKKIHSESISVAIEGVDIIFLSNFPFFFCFVFVFFFLLLFEIEPTMAHCENTAPCPALCCCCCKKKEDVCEEGD